jgi:BlaI family transcriptional regulator, penicillinase repressor
MKSLTRVEEQVMQVLWKLKSGFLKDLLQAMPEPKPHSNTVATILKILIEKGFVHTEQQGRMHRYKPAVSKQEYGKRSLTQVVRGYFENSPLKLVSHFVQENKLSQEELEQLLENIRAAKKQAP